MNKTLDARGYNCPIPVLKARKALSELSDGEQLTLLATDPASYIDIPHFCNTTGNVLLSSEEEDGVFSYIIRKTQT